VYVVVCFCGVGVFVGVCVCVCCEEIGAVVMCVETSCGGDLALSFVEFFVGVVCCSNDGDSVTLHCIG